VKRWAMHKLGVEEWLVSADMSTYTGAKTLVRTIYCNSNRFEVKVGMDWIEQGLMSHQTHYRSYRGRVFTGQMTQPTVSKH